MSVKSAAIEAWIERVIAEPWTLYAGKARAEIDMVVSFKPDGTFADDCGGWREDPPCGGCDRCIAMQIQYYIDKEREQAVTCARAGFAWLPAVQLEWLGGGRSHDKYDCREAGEFS